MIFFFLIYSFFIIWLTHLHSFFIFILLIHVLIFVLLTNFSSLLCLFFLHPYFAYSFIYFSLFYLSIFNLYYAYSFLSLLIHLPIFLNLAYSFIQFSLFCSIIFDFFFCFLHSYTFRSRLSSTCLLVHAPFSLFCILIYLYLYIFLFIWFTRIFRLSIIFSSSIYPFIFSN